MQMYRRTFAEVNLDALESNIAQIRKGFAADTFLCPMVKANAYGHGDIQIAKALEKMKIQHMGVCLIEEGLLLRQAGVKSQILVFRGFDREGAEEIIRQKMIPVVSSWEQLDHLETVAKSAIEIHVKFDTGMNRLGFSVNEAQKVFDRLWQNKKLRVKAILTHLFNGEDGAESSGDTVKQLQNILNVRKVFQPLNVFVHALNSAGIISSLQLQNENKKDHLLLKEKWGMRPGLMIYGYNPVTSAQSVKLQPVMNLKSIVASFRSVNKGEGVSYNSTWRAQKDSVIAVVPIGYADGYHRILSNQAEVLFAGQRVAVVGNICMDYLMLDVTQISAGQDLNKIKNLEVVLFGSQNNNFLSAEEVAKKAKTISWEILTSVGERVPRTYVGEYSKHLNHQTEVTV